MIAQGCTSYTQEHFINALSKCVDKQLEDRELLAGEIKKQYNNNNSMDALMTPSKQQISPDEKNPIFTNGIESR